MNDRIAEIFGYIVLATSILLFVWEYRAFTYREEDDAWLLTARRFRRRALVSVILAAIGTMILVEARGIINLHQISALTLYIFSLTGLSVLLLFLAAVDLADTAKSANRRALEEFDAAVEAEKRRSAVDAQQSSQP